MTEIERIKKSIESAVTVFVGQDENEQGIILSKQSLFYLLTTIESQQTQISGYKDVYHNEWIKQSAEKDALIKSQKEEITELREREYNHYPVVILDLETRIFKLQDDVESLKAITELAVKGLQWYTDKRNWGSIEEYGAFVSDGGLNAKNTLSEIERLQSE